MATSTVAARLRASSSRAALDWPPVGIAIAPRASAQSGGLLALSPLIENEIELIGSRCGRITDALAMLATGEVDVTPMISARYKLEQAELALRHAARPEAVKVLIEP